MSKLPTSVLIGQRVFTIEEQIAFTDTYIDGNYGYVTFTSDRIVLRRDLTPSMRRSTLLHEVMHATRQVFAPNTPEPKTFENSRDMEHWYIGVWEESLLTVLRTNPDVAAFLLATDSVKTSGK